MSDLLILPLMTFPESLALCFLALGIAGVRVESRLRRFILSSALMSVWFFISWRLFPPQSSALMLSSQFPFFVCVLILLWKVPFLFALLDVGIVLIFVLALQGILVFLSPAYSQTNSMPRLYSIQYLALWFEFAYLVALGLVARRWQLGGLSIQINRRRFLALSGWKGLVFALQPIIVAILLGSVLYLVIAQRRDDSWHIGSSEFLLLLTSATLLLGIVSLFIYAIVVAEIDARREADRVLTELVKKLPGIVYRRRCDEAVTAVFTQPGSLDLASIGAIKPLDSVGASWRSQIIMEDIPVFEAALRQAMEGRGDYSVEYRIKAKTGSPIWLWDRGTILNGDDGTVKMAEGYAADVSHRKAIETQLASAIEMKEALVKELFHRTGNSMQIISSLLRLRGASVGDSSVEALFADISLRIDALSLAQKMLLASNDLSKLDLKTYITALIGSLELYAAWFSRATRIDLDLEPVMISIDDAGSLGLALTELLLNSGRYASSDDGTSHISVKLRQEEKDWISLTVEDGGKGLPEGFDLDSLNSFGLPLAASLIRDQLKGEFNLSRGPGLRCDMRIPVSFKSRV